ncbi:MAG: ATP-grasp domain-containing protein [Gammaproteobacteria bacterium]|nr:ATP-grasp domain-containing protein [Gammaproteobacteria bacterium]
MDKTLLEGDRLYLIAESLAQDFSLFPSTESEELLPGLMPDSEIRRQCELLSNLDIDSYIEQVVARAEDPGRTAAPGVVAQLGRIVEESSEGPFYAAIVDMDFSGETRAVGFIAHDRSSKNGMWMPEHHLLAADRLQEYAKRAIPIVALMDTPGADAEEQANRENQAHSISRLITEMSNVDVPNVGVIFGLGYSGGAIPLAASNMILSVRDGVFSTIQPKGLASIARRLNLSWQECAKYVGLSACELHAQGNIDGVIDYVPGETDEKLENLRIAIVGAIQRIEERVKEFVAENPYILDHYRQSLQRFLNPSEQLQRMQAGALLKLTKNPTEYLNVFGVAYRYLRYLKVRQRIKATSTQQYGRLSDQEIPTGELDKRAELERRQTFLKWLQDPDKVVYDDALSKSWRNYNEKKQVVHDERGRIAQLLFGEPKKNYEEARSNLISTVGIFLFNRWKAEAVGNLRALKEFLNHHQDIRQILQISDLSNSRGLITAIRADAALLGVIRDVFSHEGKKLLRESGVDEKSDVFLSNQLTADLNLVITGRPLAGLIEDHSGRFLALSSSGASDVAVNRAILVDRYGDFIEAADPGGSPLPMSDMTVLDVLIGDDLRRDFVAECENLLLFDSVYDQIIVNLDSIAEEAQSGQSLSKNTLRQLIDAPLEFAAKGITLGEIGEDRTDDNPALSLREQFIDWYLRVVKMPKGSEFFRAVEEWKKTSFTHLSDTLFVVVTHLFENLLLSFVQSEREGRAYNGRISPKNIGRRKDFWNRLNIAYRDLLIQNVLRDIKNRSNIGFETFIDSYFTEFEERFGDLLSSDPCDFPGFRLSIESALAKNIPPCGIVTGIANFKDGKGGLPVGVIVSNVAFQAGCFDMASAEKFCKLLVECAEQHLPVICFISSGGMQTKEGAGALFSMAAVNDRITRFVRDHDLPVIVFGYGDCVGGAQASFVTHPLVQTYYFSGTSMPFAGQILVPSNLSLNGILSNYLSQVPGAMQGLVKHPFQSDLDDELRRIDPEIPLPQESVTDVVLRVMSGVLSQQRPVVVAHRPKHTDVDLIKPVRRVLIHARGCTAAKLIRIAQKNNIEVVLVQSDPDMESTAVDLLWERDSVVCIGGNTPDESYLNAMSVLSVAEHEGVDALHPGIGFLSENAQFAELCRSHGINFIGPPVSSMDTMGNKSNAINTALRLGVPVVPGSHGILTNEERAAEVAEDIGYPVLIKAVHGGGGKGIQVVENASEFHEQFHRVRAEARSAFGNGDVYLEKYITSLRHIEVQLLRDTHGNTLVLGLRDCSVQRDKQKVFEESGSTMLPEHLHKAVLEYPAAIADEVGYVGAGTVEFIYDLDSNDIYFMEMNTRLQVEHPVTEWVSGIDIVTQQFRIASGESIADLTPTSDGYSIEARVTAEKVQMSANGELVFRPHPGEIIEFEFPQDDGVEVIAAASAGKMVSPYYDSMLAQVIVHAKGRRRAINKLLAYLERVKVTGICTNIPLLKRVLQDDVYIEGTYDTNYLTEFLQRTDAKSLIEEIEHAAGEQLVGIDLAAIKIEDSDELKVLSPTTAIFYITPTPSEPQFVSVGDKISVQDTLCQLEAMKLFTPLSLADFNIEAELYDAEMEFEVTRINMANGQQVNAGDLLFVVKPSSS